MNKQDLQYELEIHKEYNVYLKAKEKQQEVKEGYIKAFYKALEAHKSNYLPIIKQNSFNNNQ
jgi:hypothetical protein